MQVVEDEQHCLFDCPLYKQIREQHDFLLKIVLEHGSIRPFLERNAAHMSSVAQYRRRILQALASQQG